MSSLVALLSLEDVGDGNYTTKTSSKGRNRINSNSSYGGYAIGIAIRAAFASLPPSGSYHIYSALGNFLGPALVGIPSTCAVRSVRDTRTFATRFVEVKQEIRGALRTVMTVLCDFQAAESLTPLMSYSAPPALRYTGPDAAPPLREMRRALVSSGVASQAQADTHEQVLGMMQGFFDQRPCPEGVFAQNLGGFAKQAPTTQDGLPLTERTGADWYRLCEGGDAARTPAEHASALGYFMDGYCAFAPLVFTRRFVEDTEAAASLDFALRFFRTGDEIDFNKWHLRELQTIAGAHGRTYSESRLWDESGNLVCIMTQQCILRAKKAQEKL